MMEMGAWVSELIACHHHPYYHLSIIHTYDFCFLAHFFSDIVYASFIVYENFEKP
jgi:hypothetical protein